MGEDDSQYLIENEKLEYMNKYTCKGLPNRDSVDVVFYVRDPFGFAGVYELRYRVYAVYFDKTLLSAKDIYSVLKSLENEENRLFEIHGYYWTEEDRMLSFSFCGNNIRLFIENDQFDEGSLRVNAVYRNPYSNEDTFMVSTGMCYKVARFYKKK